MTGATERATATRTLSEADFAVPISDRPVLSLLAMNLLRARGQAG